MSKDKLDDVPLALTVLNGKPSPWTPFGMDTMEYVKFLKKNTCPKCKCYLKYCTCGKEFEEYENKSEMDKLRSSTMYKGEILKVRYTGKAGNFFKGQVIDAVPRMVHGTGLPYPQPKWIVCEYYITDSDGDNFPVARDRYGELYKGFEWVRERDPGNGPCDCPYKNSCHIPRQEIQTEIRWKHGYKVEDCDCYKLLKPMYEEKVGKDNE